MTTFPGPPTQPVRAVPDAEKIKLLPDWGKFDTRNDDDKAADKARAEYVAAVREARRDKSRKEQSDAEARAYEMTHNLDRVYATRVASRSTTALNRWSDVRAAMKHHGVQVHPTTDGFTISRPAATGAGESPKVAVILQTRRRTADQLIDTIASTWGALVASDNQPTCGVAKCRKRGEWGSAGWSNLICDKHAGRK